MSSDDAESLVATLRTKLNEANAERETLRAALAYGNDPCIYCGLPKADMARCAHGFPGCARADDMMAQDDPWPHKTDSTEKDAGNE